MLEIAILVCFAAIFIILATRFPKTRDFTFPESKTQEERSILEVKKILKERHEKREAEGATNGIPKAVDELDQYDEELAKILRSARDKIRGGKYVSAEKLLIDAICKDSKCVWAYEKLGSIYLTIGKNLTDAEESFLMALKLDRENAASWFGVGQIYFSQGKINQAIDCFLRAVNISRTTAEYQASLGKAYMEVRQYGRAAKSLKRAASLDISNEEYKKLASIAEDKHREHTQASKLG